MFVCVADTTPAPTPVVGIASTRGTVATVPVRPRPAMPRQSAAGALLTSGTVAPAKPSPAKSAVSQGPAPVQGTPAVSQGSAPTAPPARPSERPVYPWRTAWTRPAAPRELPDAERERIVALRAARAAAKAAPPAPPPSDAERLQKVLEDIRPKFKPLAPVHAHAIPEGAFEYGGFEDRGLEPDGDGDVRVTYHVGDVRARTVHCKRVKTAMKVVLSRGTTEDPSPFTDHKYTHATITVDGAPLATVTRREWLEKNPAIIPPELRRPATVMKDHRPTYNATQNRAPNSWFGRCGNEAAYR